MDSDLVTTVTGYLAGSSLLVVMEDVVPGQGRCQSGRVGVLEIACIVISGHRVWRRYLYWGVVPPLEVALKELRRSRELLVCAKSEKVLYQLS